MIKLNTKKYNLQFKNNKLTKITKSKPKPKLKPLDTSLDTPTPTPTFKFEGTARQLLGKLLGGTTKKELKSVLKQFGYKNVDSLIDDLSALGKGVLESNITPSRLKNLKDRNLIESMKGIMGEEKWYEWLNDHGITELYVINHFIKTAGTLTLPNGDVYKWLWDYNNGQN